MTENKFFPHQIKHTNGTWDKGIEIYGMRCEMT
jgi:hypothetical protein